MNKILSALAALTLGLAMFAVAAPAQANPVCPIAVGCNLPVAPPCPVTGCTPPLAPGLPAGPGPITPPHTGGHLTPAIPKSIPARTR